MHDLVLYFHVDHGSDEKQNSKALWLEDTKFSHSGPQRAAVESKDLCSAVLATHLPISLLKTWSLRSTAIYRLLLDFAIFGLVIFPGPDQPAIRKPLCLEDRLFSHRGHIA